MKKLLLLAVVAAATASQVQAVGTCAMDEVRCATPATQQTVTCPGCPPCICPKPAETTCTCEPARPVKTEVCKEVAPKCGSCHKARAQCGCRGGFVHHHAHTTVEEKAAPAPKRVRSVRSARMAAE